MSALEPGWLEELAEESRARLAALPPESQPSWFRLRHEERADDLPDNVIPFPSRRSMP